MKGAPEQGKAGKKGGSPVNGSDMYKLKTTVQTLEASLSKKNKEIIELKKSRNDDDNSFQNLGNFLLLFFNIPIRKVFMKFVYYKRFLYVKSSKALNVEESTLILHIHKILIFNNT